MKWTTDEFTGKRFGKYEVLCRLAIGGMAEIFLGYAHAGPFLGRPVVIKRILNEQREDPNALQMLLDEAKMTATLSHPNVAQVLDLETADDEVLLVIEFIQGANLEEIVEAFQARGEPVPLGFVIAVIREAAQGLGHAHGHKNSRGEAVPIIHRDVTPRNVMVDFDGAIKVLDFGIARAKGSERRTQAGMVRGTTAYMSPEQAVGKELDPRTDLFSLGIIFHELLTAARLFYKGNPGQEMAAVYEGEIPIPSKVNRRVPRALDAVVMHSLERKLDRRYQTALEFTRDLSLAAGSSAWGKERCAELVRERFSARQKEIEKLISRIPSRGSGADFGEVRTIIQRGGTVPRMGEDSSAARTLVGGQPLGDRRPTASAGNNTEPGIPREVVTDPGRPSPLAPQRSPTPRPQPPTDPDRAAIPPASPAAGARAPALNAAELFDQEFPEERTRIIPGSRQSLPPVVDVPTDPNRAPVRRPSSRLEPAPVADARRPSRFPLVVAAFGALVLGAAGGAYLLKRFTPEAPAATLVRVSLSSDRPALVFLGRQKLGQTPVSLLVPAGEHELVFAEEDGKRHGLHVSLPPSDAETQLAVTLDSLTLLP